MIILIRNENQGVRRVENIISNWGYDYILMSRYRKTMIRISDYLKDKKHLDILKELSEVEDIIMDENPYFLVSKRFKSQDTLISVGRILIGNTLSVIAGPCSVESYDQLKAIATFLKSQGVNLLRGGAYKPRTSPYSFQGLEEKGLKMLRSVADELNMFVVTEAIDIPSFDYVERYADIIQIGARNMQNFSLLKRAGHAKKPILLKRGFMSTIDEFLSAAEYVVFHGNENVILCERGIRTYEPRTRFTLDISAIPVLKELTHLPVIVDPSHAAGRRSLVIPLAQASLASGADGIMVEVHNNPDMAVSDGKQSLTFSMFEELMKKINVKSVYGKRKDSWPFMQPSFS